MAFNFRIFMYIIIFMSAWCYVKAAQVKLPQGFVQCKQNDPNFENCVLKALQLSISPLVKGQRKFGLPTIDPLYVKSIHIDQGRGPIKMIFNVTNFNLIGMSKTKIEKVRVDPRKKFVEVLLRVTEPLTLNGTYKIDGKILVLPISGDGRGRVVSDGFTSTTRLHFKEVRSKDNELYWHLDKLDLDFSMTRMFINFENLFNGNKRLENEMNNFLNKNWDIILDELRPVLTNVCSAIYSEYVRRFFDRVPISKIFPAE